jgi:hypothetical protein
VAEIEEVHEPWQRGGGYCLWNQALLPSLERKYIPESDHGPYYRVDSALPVIEFSYPLPVQELWNGKPALTQGRVWAGFEHENKDFDDPGKYRDAITVFCTSVPTTRHPTINRLRMQQKSRMAR